MGDALATRRDGSPLPVTPRRFLSVWFRCCHAYGRLYRNRQQTAFEGRCPRCGTPVAARIGQDGTTRRLFEAR